MQQPDYLVINNEKRAYLFGWFLLHGVFADQRCIIRPFVSDPVLDERFLMLKSHLLPEHKSNENTEKEAPGSIVIDRRTDDPNLLSIFSALELFYVSRSVGMPRLNSNELQWHFVRGMYEAGSVLSYKHSLKDAPVRGELRVDFNAHDSLLRHMKRFFAEHAIETTRVDDLQALTLLDNQAHKVLQHMYQGATYTLPALSQEYQSSIAIMQLQPPVETAKQLPKSLHQILTEAEAYYYGWLFACAEVKGIDILVRLHKQASLDTFEQLRVVLDPNSKLHEHPFTYFMLDADLVPLPLPSATDSATLRMPQLSTKELQWHFLRGYYEARGKSVLNKQQDIVCGIEAHGASIKRDIISFAGVPAVPTLDYSHFTSDVCWVGCNAEDVMFAMYENATHYTPTDKKHFLATLQLQQHLDDDLPAFRYELVHPDAVAPTKARPSDSGFDLWLVEKIKEENGVHYYTTGVKIDGDGGFDFRLYPRSSIGASGYMLQNSIGLLDAPYRGEIVAGLRKVSTDTAELKLPCKLVQLVAQRRVHIRAVQGRVANNTARGQGGFGSTNKQ